RRRVTGSIEKLARAKAKKRIQKNSESSFLFSETASRSVFGLTPLLNLLVVAVDGALVLLDLLLIGLVLLLLLSLHVVADQSAGAEAESAADGRARARMADGGADDAARRRAADGADAGALFARGHGTAGAAGHDHRCKGQRAQTQ